MRRFCWFVIAATLLSGFSFASDAPSIALRATSLRQSNHLDYYWETTPIGNTAELLTLFCRSCQAGKRSAGQTSEKAVPLVAVLRDTLGDNSQENDRVSYVWLLGYSRPNLGRRLLSAVPFFYWRVGKGPQSVDPHDTAPLLNLTSPQPPAISEMGRSVLQWTVLDPMTMPVRATSRSYRANQSDYERLHLAEAIGYLRNAPVRDDDAGLTHVELNTVIARLELRKRMLGGFVSQRQAALVGEDDGFEHERIRSRNWELLRQCAERTGLIFEPIDLSSRPGQYAILWFPLGESSPNPGFPLEPIWKLLNIRDPWSDSRLKQWSGVTYQRSLDESGSFVPVRADAPRQVSLVPLAVYSLSYRKAPLLLLDFRDRLHVRRHEMTQRTINEVTAGVIGISHFTNWYYYVAADLYNFVTARHGAAVDQSARLDCYSAFRAELRLDNQLDPVLRAEMERRVQSLDVNPLESSPERDLQVAQARYDLLQSEARTNGSLLVHLEKDRRSELAAFGETPRQKLAYSLLHLGSFGLYTHRLKEDPSNLALLDRDRRIGYELGFLDSLVAAGTQPQVAYDTLRIQGAVVDLSGMMSRVDSPELRAHVEVTLERLRGLSSDGDLRASCSEALLSLNHGKDAAAASSAQAGVNATNALALVHAVAEPPR